MKLDTDHAVGALFVTAGATAAFLGVGYGLGTPGEMGAGALPALLGSTLVLFGIVLLVRSPEARQGAVSIASFARRERRPLVFVLGALLAFGLLVPRVGLLPGLAALIAIGWFADTRGRLRELPVLGAAVILLILAIFYFGLGIPFRLFDWSI